jgi:XTP/dITP diphosphohydrolase
MQQLIFATNNNNKVAEVNQILGHNYHIITLQAAGIQIDIPEPWQTLEENAREKSTTIYTLTGKSCFAEDSGLEIDALNGAPGVHSAHYAGPQRSNDDNIALVLQQLQHQPVKKARFRTIISLILAGKEIQFEGICSGQIVESKRGSGGFGYDPIFMPDGHQLTFAEMSLAEKAEISHRKQAIDKLTQYLKNV